MSSADIMSEVLSDVGREGRGEMAGDNGANSLLPIVSSQRERFKQRNTELEAVRKYCSFACHLQVEK